MLQMIKGMKILEGKIPEQWKYIIHLFVLCVVLFGFVVYVPWVKYSNEFGFVIIFTISMWMGGEGGGGGGGQTNQKITNRPW